MSLTEQINQDIKDAMRAREKEKLESLRAIKTALMLESTKGAEIEISDETGLKILQKLHKQRLESAEIYKSQNREDLAEAELAQANYIEVYLPKQLSREEIAAEVKSVIEATGASGMADMGKVMGQVSKKLAGKADGRIIAEIVKEQLGS